MKTITTNRTLAAKRQALFKRSACPFGVAALLCPLWFAPESAIASDNCVEHGPHYSDWFADWCPELNNTPSVTPSSLCAVINTPLPVPTIVTPTFDPGLESRWVYYDCTNYSYYEDKSFSYTIGPVQWDPFDPAQTTFPYPTNVSSEAYVIVSLDDLLCLDCYCGRFYIGGATWNVVDNTPCVPPDKSPELNVWLSTGGQGKGTGYDYSHMPTSYTQTDFSGTIGDIYADFSYEKFADVVSSCGGDGIPQSYTLPAWDWDAGIGVGVEPIDLDVSVSYHEPQASFPVFTDCPRHTCQRIFGKAFYHKVTPKPPIVDGTLTVTVWSWSGPPTDAYTAGTPSASNYTGPASFINASPGYYEDAIESTCCETGCM